MNEVDGVTAPSIHLPSPQEESVRTPGPTHVIHVTYDTPYDALRGPCDLHMRRKQPVNAFAGDAPT